MAESFNVRRCHVCGEVNEGKDDILKCSSCRKSLLPFYYFDKRKLTDYGVVIGTSPRLEKAFLRHAPLFHMEIAPVFGLCVQLFFVLALDSVFFFFGGGSMWRAYACVC